MRETVLTEVDAHPILVGEGISAIETPAASAVRTLAKRAKGLKPGLYAVSPDDNVLHGGPPRVVDKCVFQGMRLLVGERDIPSPEPSERISLGRYAGLMYQRAPRPEEAMLAWGKAFDIAAQRAVDQFLPGFHAGIQTELAHRRTQMLKMASDIGDRLANATRWLVVAGPDEAFILGDAPVAATISLGHEDAGCILHAGRLRYAH